MASHPTNHGFPLRRRDSVSSMSSVRSVRSMLTPRELSTDSLLTIEDRFVRRPRTQRPRLSNPASESRLSLPPPASVRETYYFPNGEVFRPRSQPRPKSGKHHSMPNMRNRHMIVPPVVPPTQTTPVPTVNSVQRIQFQETGSSVSSASASPSVDHGTPASSITFSEEEEEEKRGFKKMLGKLLRKDKSPKKNAVEVKSQRDSDSSLEHLSMSSLSLNVDLSDDDDKSFVAGDDQDLDGGDLETELDYISSIMGIGETYFFEDLDHQDKLIKRKSLRMKSLEKHKSLSRKNTGDSHVSLDTEYYKHHINKHYSGEEKFEIVTSNRIKEPATTALEAKSSVKTRSFEQLKVSFSNKIYLNTTFSPDSYVRFNKGLKHTYSQLAKDPEQIKEIRAELNHYKQYEMAVHKQSREYTHYFQTA
ncbi:hypothetical protein OGAPHI_005311 [Ogataea philodendri]|uniref:Uncharacterized protein n=1 Tax=Ogataea philodendri TaxID=1378263 RepID=A0A9P8T308_9ASCO|nr:uncharacterized protein OGAPHI_005311 [Ogataea philodendri]KAH3663321.1 hypothetical protein OGAPHI_005311 [Ogataea philodendri]